LSQFLESDAELYAKA